MERVDPLRRGSDADADPGQDVGFGVEPFIEPALNELLVPQDRARIDVADTCGAANLDRQVDQVGRQRRVRLTRGLARVTNNIVFFGTK